MAKLRWGRVAAVHPEDYSLDLVMTDDGSHLAGVQVLTPFASSNTGCADLPSPSVGDQWSLTESRSLDVLAGVAFFERYPVVIGFRFPQVSQMLFADLERRINRHASDVYSTIDADGNVEFYHPSGTYFRIGESPSHEDLTGKDFDGRWKIDKNTGKSVHVHLSVASAGSEVASIDIDPGGNVTLTHSGNLAVNTTGTADVTVTGNATVKSPAVKIDAPETTCTGNLTVNGGLNVQGGGSGGTSKINGTMQITGPQLTHNGKSVGSDHKHGGVQSGSSETDVPV